MLVGSAFPGAADLAVLSNGHVLKVDEFRVTGEMVRMVLSSGGALVVPLAVVERVIDDEIVPVTEQVVPVPTDLSLTFSDSAEAPETPYGELILEASRRHGVSSDLVAAMVRAESAFDPRAVSHKGARGLLQLMPATAMRFGVSPESLFDPRQNLEAGVSYVKWLADRFPDTPSLVLAAYNAGEGSVAKYGGVPPYRETREYIRRVYSSLGLEADSVLAATR
jgi:soluble lytic murein transglycosylase-like protein